MIFLWLLLTLLHLASAARILAVFPVGSKSQFYFNEAVMKSLHAAGHNITFISPYPSEDRVENYKMVNSEKEKLAVGTMPLEYLLDVSLNRLLEMNTQSTMRYCLETMKLQEIQEALNSSTKLYDVLFVGLIPLYHCYLPIAQKLDIPVIGTAALRSQKSTDAEAIGLPNHPATIPFEFTDSKPAMTFSMRVKNLWNHITSDYHTYLVRPATVNQIFEKLDLDTELRNKKKVSLVFYNSHASLLPRPMVPNVIEVGGIHTMKPFNALPRDLQDFIDGAEHGVILLTFGSMVKTSSISAEWKSALRNAFAAIPQRVIWKYDGEMEGISDNVLLSSWVPQFDLLSHKNVKVFISHCGVNGMYEAVYTGTPVLATPLVVDQHSNSVVLEELGVALRIDMKTVTTEKVLRALNTLINDTGFHDRMQELSRIFKDRPITPQQSVVYWTEYVIKHNGASQLRVAGSEMPLYQYFLLDIVLLISAVVIAASCVLYCVSKKLVTLIMKGFKYSTAVAEMKKHR